MAASSELGMSPSVLVTKSCFKFISLSFVPVIDIAFSEVSHSNKLLRVKVIVSLPLLNGKVAVKTIVSKPSYILEESWKSNLNS